MGNIFHTNSFTNKGGRDELLLIFCRWGERTIGGSHGFKGVQIGDHSSPTDW